VSGIQKIAIVIFLCFLVITCPSCGSNCAFNALNHIKKHITNAINSYFSLIPPPPPERSLMSYSGQIKLNCLLVFLLSYSYFRPQYLHFIITSSLHIFENKSSSIPLGGIEPPLSPYKEPVLPLNYRGKTTCHGVLLVHLQALSVN
jgi:hypothetical protein